MSESGSFLKEKLEHLNTLHILRIFRCFDRCSVFLVVDFRDSRRARHIGSVDFYFHFRVSLVVDVVLAMGIIDLHIQILVSVTVWGSGVAGSVASDVGVALYHVVFL